MFYCFVLGSISGHHWWQLDVYRGEVVQGRRPRLPWPLLHALGKCHHLGKEVCNCKYERSFYLDHIYLTVEESTWIDLTSGIPIRGFY